jgi:Zn-finger nucleic acid-binding protein
MSMYADDRCPKCKGDLKGAPIDKADRESYGNKTHFSRVIGIYSREQDKTVAWRCPDCGFEEPR